MGIQNSNKSSYYNLLKTKMKTLYDKIESSEANIKYS